MEIVIRGNLGRSSFVGRVKDDPIAPRIVGLGILPAKEQIRFNISLSGERNFAPLGVRVGSPP